ncbi:MAG: peptide MFS transporter [Bacteroidales bacterium]|jgi:POT family proton-dependent oligopeptide transporter|nr:peptide MFS transporter [Bacteroidales bacterium]
MFKGHPKGLIAAALANMGERFGFYTMMAILVLFLQAKFGLSGKDAGLIYSVFYFSIYILAFVGGLIADRLRNYKGTILTGILIMAVGYVIVAMPSPTPVPESSRMAMLVLTLFGLFVIAFGNGLFKGNLQALVGQMYDNEKYGKLRDSGFSIFYMFINVGAIFAPFAAIGIRNWWLNNHGFSYNPDLPALCHKHLGSGLSQEALARFEEIKASVGGAAQSLDAFANEYLNIFTTGYHYAFGIAVGAMAISLIIYLMNNKKFPTVQKKAKAGEKTEAIPEMSVQEIRQRLYALFAVFGIVIFFWFSFHQNGLTLTMFARDYTDLSGIAINLGFVTIEGAEIFQSVNPLFIVLLTPIIVGFFGWLRAKGLEPSTPKKIAIGMGIAATAYLVMTLGSLGLPAFETIDPAQDGTPLEQAQRVTPFLLIGTYLILTIAELFISPLGISFVSKVAPPQYQGIMQGGWLGATAIGNQLLFIGAILYESVPLWLTWTMFVVVCVMSMATMIFMLKWLERITK